MTGCSTDRSCLVPDRKSRLGVLEQLLPSVRGNALLSDARFWGSFSLCGLLLRLREQYRFEKRIPVDAPLPEREVAQWVGSREKAWESLDGEYRPVPLDGRSFDAFDEEGINGALLPMGFVYGAGIGIHDKPVFFLADLAEDRQLGGGTRILVSGREHVRDLSLHPAMTRGSLIHVRKDPLETLLWGKFEEFRGRPNSGPLQMAFGGYGVNDTFDAAARYRVTAAEAEALIGHEMGEMDVTARLGPAWGELAGALHPGRPAFFIHSLRQMWADTAESGMIRHIVTSQSMGSLGFYLSFLEGYRRVLADPIRQASKSFSGELHGWEAVEEARGSIYGRVSSVLFELVDRFARSRDVRIVEQMADKYCVQWQHEAV